ncbi:MAG: ATP-dependent Clp protease proteolytic subunit [Leptospirales bacterium]|nr:ATP-dependent Clp protease proteolytic subunit [Leptospirales bacterium]
MSQTETPQPFQSVAMRIDQTLLEQRKVYLWGQVDDDSARHIVERLLYLEARDPGKDITLYINSPGGVITSGMAIYDTMQMISSDVSTVCMGLAASMGALLLCGGKKGKRYAWPHARIMIHQPLISGQIIAPAVDIKIQAEEIRKIREELNRIIAAATGRNLEQVEMDTDRDYYLNAREALEYGIVDGVTERV